MTKKLKSILIRELTEEERQAVEVVKSRTGLGHACRAVMAAVVSFERTERITARYREENERLKAENKRLRRCLKQALANSETICSILKEGTAEKTDGNRGQKVVP